MLLGRRGYVASGLAPEISELVLEANQVKLVCVQQVGGTYLFFEFSFVGLDATGALAPPYRSRVMRLCASARWTTGAPSVALQFRCWNSATEMMWRACRQWRTDVRIRHDSQPDDSWECSRKDGEW
jgi:hypothetical protein